MKPQQAALSAALTGTVASFFVTAALAAFARRQGKSALQPVNATSHWLEGPGAGRQRGTDLRHTGVGLVTNHAASVFWALPLELLLSSGNRTPGRVAAHAALVSGVAAMVDYGVVPRRLTPGWEHAVGMRGVATGFAALAAGLFVGALVSGMRPRKASHAEMRETEPRSTARPVRQAPSRSSTGSPGDLPPARRLPA